MNEGLNPIENKINRSMDAKLGSFETLVSSVPESTVLLFRKDERLMSLLRDAGFPTDEALCDTIGNKVGIGAPEVAAVSLYEQKLMAEAKRSTQH